MPSARLALLLGVVSSSSSFGPEETWNVKSVALKKRRGLLRSTVQKKKKRSLLCSFPTPTKQTKPTTQPLVVARCVCAGAGAG